MSPSNPISLFTIFDAASLIIKAALLVIKNSEMSFLKFSFLVTELTANCSRSFKIFAKLIGASEDLTDVSLLERSYDKNVGSPSQIKNLPFESGKMDLYC